MATSGRAPTITTNSTTAPAARRRGRPPRISPELIVDAAVELGIDNLTMQALATRLGVTTPALYTHVSGRDEVVDLVAQALRHRVREFAADTDDWRVWLRAFAHLVHAQLAPSAVTVLAGQDDGDPVGRVGVAERGLQLLIAEGLTAEEAGATIWHVYRLALTSGTPANRMFDVHVRETATVLDADPDNRFPATDAVRRALSSTDHDALAFDLALVVDGIAARLDRIATRPPAEATP